MIFLNCNALGISCLHQEEYGCLATEDFVCSWLLCKLLKWLKLALNTITIMKFVSSLYKILENLYFTCVKVFLDNYFHLQALFCAENSKCQLFFFIYEQHVSLSDFDGPSLLWLSKLDYLNAASIQETSGNLVLWACIQNQVTKAHMTILMFYMQCKFVTFNIGCSLSKHLT